jgi:molybdopterin-guanine dinucleotide biosynthesis protein A
MDDVAGFVLAGGRSRRMGCDKAFLEISGGTLLARALAAVRAVTADVRIVGPVSRFAAHAPTIEDVYAERGPLGGIHAALCASGKELNLMAAVDLPRITPALLRFLCEQARGSGAVVTVPHAGGRLQPLCAVYRGEFARLAAEALEQGRNRIDLLFERCRVRVIAEEELRSAGFDAAMFANLNTPGEVEQLRRRLE